MDVRTHTISGNNDENVEEGLSNEENKMLEGGIDKDVDALHATEKKNKKRKNSIQPRNIRIKTKGDNHPCSEGCVPIPCMYHKIGKMIVWLGPKRPYNLNWPLTCFVGPDFGCMLCTYSLFLVPSLAYLLVCSAEMHVVANGIFYFSFGGLLFMYTMAACSDPGIVEKNDPDIDVHIPKGQTLCSYCNVARERGTVHCYECDACILELDHHCPWTGKCIGKKNLFYFYGFLSFLCFHLAVIVIELMIWIAVRPR
eukprot:g9030.t1